MFSFDGAEQFPTTCPAAHRARLRALYDRMWMGGCRSFELILKGLPRPRAL
jgi:hypothetical protein